MNQKTAMAALGAALMLACSPPGKRGKLEPSHVDSAVAVAQTQEQGTAWGAIAARRPEWLMEPEVTTVYLVLRCTDLECLQRVQRDLVDRIRLEPAADGARTVSVYLKRRVWVEGSRIASRD